MSHAQTIFTLWESGAKEEARRMTERLFLTLTQDWDGEATLYELSDESLIYISGPELRIGTIADKYIGGRLQVTPEDFFYAENERFELIADTGTATIYEFFDGSQVAIDTDGNITRATV